MGGMIKSSVGHTNFKIFLAFRMEPTNRIWKFVWVSGERKNLKYKFERNLHLDRF